MVLCFTLNRMLLDDKVGYVVWTSYPFNKDMNQNYLELKSVTAFPFTNVQAGGNMI